jgi:hypothetical protein
MTEARKRRKPVHHHSKPASKNKQRQSTRIAQELISMILAALIFSASVWSSVFGMSGMHQPETIQVAGVSNGR